MYIQKLYYKVVFFCLYTYIFATEMICISFLGLTRKKIIFSSGSNLYLIHLYKYVVFFSYFCIFYCPKWC